jgi:hypothetical protein
MKWEIENSIKHILGEWFIVAISIFAVLYIPLNFHIGLAFRYDFTTVIFLLLLASIAINQLPVRSTNYVMLLLIAMLFALPISGLWNSGQSEQYILGGIIPFSDARYYFMDARRLLEGFDFVTGAARRPLFTALLSTIQWVTSQDLLISIAIITAIIALAVHFAVMEIRHKFGVFAGLLLLILIFLFARSLMGKTLSEMAGLPLGLISFVFLFRGAREKQFPAILLGLFFMSLVQNARAGALLILPVIILWVGWLFRDSRKFDFTKTAIAGLVVALGFAVNMIVFMILASSDSMPFGNFSHTLYGLARGGLGWTQIYTDHPETWSMPADSQANYIYSLAYEIISRKPLNLLHGILSSYTTFFSLDDYYGSLCWFGGVGLIGNIARTLLYCLMVFGAFLSARKLQDPVNSLLIAGLIGIFISVPFAPPLDSNRMRVYAATIPFYAAIAVIGFSWLEHKIPFKFFRSPETQKPSIMPVSILGIIVLVAMTIIPILIRSFTPATIIEKGNCPQGLKQISFRLLPGNYIEIVDDPVMLMDRIPQLRNHSFDTLVHNLPNWETFPLFTETKPGQIILADLELSEMKEIILIADWNVITRTTESQSVCDFMSEDRMLRDYRVYFASDPVIY